MREREKEKTGLDNTDMNGRKHKWKGQMTNLVLAGTFANFLSTKRSLGLSGDAAAAAAAAGGFNRQKKWRNG